ncbi:MAG: hypothetical protein CBC28_05000 [Flavobacteriaceae bacterium TMED68]|nr:MAG: hypothetical protein CBC28_05000 [Flavobacteriaceae bacterium TMED68]
MIFNHLLISLALLFCYNLDEHPLRLSLCEIEYFSETRIISINLKLFLTDVNEAILFDPNNNQLAFCQPNESINANQMLLDYVNRYFYVKVNEESIPLEIKNKRLSGEDENTALWIYLEHSQLGELNSIEIKNAIFTDLFFDQNNIVYIHHNNQSNSVMLNKKTSVYQLKF